MWRCTNPLSRLGGGAQDGHMCPLCGENIPGAADELIAHVDVCTQGVSVGVKGIGNLIIANGVVFYL